MQDILYVIDFAFTIPCEIEDKARFFHQDIIPHILFPSMSVIPPALAFFLFPFNPFMLQLF